MKSKLSVLVLVVVLTVLAATPMAAAPLASPCAAGAAYNPACDVNQDGAVNVLDVQLTAGHWNQTGTFTSDNSHNHLGQTWTGTNNPLTITGAYGAPLYAPLNLSNSTGVGLRITSADSSGIFIDSTSDNGMWVYSAANAGVRVESAGHDGLFVCHTGTANTCSPSPYNNGVEVGNAQGNGLFVDSAGADGVWVSSAVYTGVQVDSAGSDGLHVSSAGYDGVYANTNQPSGQWGFNTPDAIHGSNVLLHSLSLVAQVTGPDSLTPGDIVAVAGITDPVPGSTVHTALVRLAGGSFTNVVGVVESHLALTQQPSPAQPVEGETPTETPVSELRSVDGPAQAGDFVAITVMGAALVKVQDGEVIQAGQRLTIAANGRARPLATMKVQLAGGQGTADMLESAPVIGVALEAAKDGMVWVLVNPQ
jgi:hypothetical protein